VYGFSFIVLIQLASDVTVRVPWQKAARTVVELLTAVAIAAPSSRRRIKRQRVRGIGSARNGSASAERQARKRPPHIFNISFNIAASCERARLLRLDKARPRSKFSRTGSASEFISEFIYSISLGASCR